MNNYFTLRRANRLRVKLLNSKSQEQIREVIRYLRRTSWDECGVELIYSDLIDMAVQANENGQELFNVIEDAKTFAEEVKSSLKTLRTGDYFWFVAPLYFFFGWGIEVCITAFCWLFRKMMEQAGFPPSKHRLKYCGWLVLYIAVLYATGAFFTRIAGAFVLLRLPILPYALFSLLLGAGLYGIKFWKYGKDERLRERI